MNSDSQDESKYTDRIYCPKNQERNIKVYTQIFKIDVAVRILSYLLQKMYFWYIYGT